MNLMLPALWTAAGIQLTIAAANSVVPKKLHYRENLSKVSHQNRMWPASYWRLWSDSIVHHIHLRVFRHIQQLAEHDAQAMRAATK